MLITFLQKGLAYVGIEEHLNEVRTWLYLYCTCCMSKCTALPWGYIS